MKQPGTIGRWLTSGVVGLGIGFASTGCHSSSDGKGALIGGTAAAVSSGSAAAGGSGLSASALPPGISIPGLPADPSVLEGPRVDIVSPSNGAYVAGGQVKVEGVVTDLGQGIAELHVAGRTVPVGPGGAFSETVDLPAGGLQTIVVEAWDRAQHRRARHVSVMLGATGDEATALENVSALRVTETALDLVEPSIAQGVEAQRAQITQQALATPVGNDTKITGFRFGKVGATVDAAPGGARFVVTIDDVQMDIEHKAKFLLVFNTTKKGTVRAQQVRIEGLTAIAVQGGRATTQVLGVTAATSGFSVPDWASSEQGTIKRTFEQSFATAGARGLDQGLADAFKSTSGSMAQNVQGLQLTLDWALKTLACDEAGITAIFAANVKPQAATAGQAGKDSFVSKVGLANLSGGSTGGPNVGVAVHEDLVNRTLHAAWRGGALKFTLDKTTAAALPPGSPSLDTNALLAVAPELAAVGVTPGLPVELEVQGDLPAVVRFRGTQGPHRLSLGARPRAASRWPRRSGPSTPTS
jgi:hypothetical protein